MFPLLGALVGAVGSGIAGNKAAQEQERTRNYNRQIDLYNFYLRERERDDARQQADQTRSDQQLGGTDANGTRTRFVPGQGWVVELTPEMAQLRDAQTGEQQQVLSHDLPMRRAQLDRNNARQLDEDYQAGGLLDEFQNVQRDDPTAIKNSLVAARTHGLNESLDQSLQSVLRKGLRSGASNTGNIVSELQRGHAREMDRAFLESELMGEDIADQRYNSKRGNSANLYNMFAERAGRMPGVSYAPSNVDGAGNSLMAQFSQRGLQGDAAATNTAGMRGGERSYEEPSYGDANRSGSVWSNIGAGLSNFGAQQDYQLSMSQLYDYMRRNGQSGSTTGNYGSI